MSVLLLEPEGAVGEAVVTRLVGAGDQVEVVESSSERAQTWRSLGARVALTKAITADLVERAGQQARTIVVFAGRGGPNQEVTEAVLGAAQLLRESPRVVLCTTSASAEVVDVLEASALDYVVLRTMKAGRRFGRAQVHSAEDVAEAIDAADDLDGNPRLDLDLSGAQAWRTLKLDPR